MAVRGKKPLQPRPLQTKIMIKIVTVIGARPQFFKAAVVSRALREHGQDVREVILHTGRHCDAKALFVTPTTRAADCVVRPS